MFTEKIVAELLFCIPYPNELIQILQGEGGLF